MSFKPRAPLPSTAFTLPARYYTDASVFSREMELFYRQMWTAIGRLELLDIPGRWGRVDAFARGRVDMEPTRRRA